jgi:aryl-alcohol dehydrogenase-like predicted oxidoreductase
MVGIGCMRLSTEDDRDERRALSVLHAALDAGVTLFDTADAYCRDDNDTGHNERLIAAALASWRGPEGSRVRIATKGGFTRPQGRWFPDCRARHLTRACESSLRALGVNRIDLYQLHVVDPQTPLATSIRALAALKRDGLIERIGLCNVTVGQIEEARRITEIDAVQVEVSVWQDSAILGGVIAHCAANGIELLAYRPLGSPSRHHRTRTDPALAAVAGRHGATPFEVALAWVRDLSASIVPLPGPTRVDTIASIVRASRLALTDDDRALLDERFPAGRIVRRTAGRLERVPDQVRRDGEIVVIMGLPGAGKSTVAVGYVDDGYTRLNRDDRGGTLKALLPALDAHIDAGSSRFVLDNTYLSRKSRAEVIELGRARGLPVRCVCLDTSIEDAQVNAVTRVLDRFGRLLEPDEMRAMIKTDSAAFGPSAQFRSQRSLEPPDPREGVARIDVIPFSRRSDPSLTNRAVIVWCDAALDADAAARGDVLRHHAADGWRILGIGWQPALAEKSATIAEVDASYARLQERLGIAIDVVYCPHGGGPPVCWCRKPLPGLGVVLIRRHQLDPRQCIYVGSGPQDPGFARRLGFQYRSSEEFFG